MTEFQFDCEFCDRTVSGATAATVKERGKNHLDGDHHAELADPFVEARGDEPCRNDCGYVFPVGVDEVSGFDCPECGHDHLPAFLDRYLYWRIEAA